MADKLNLGLGDSNNTNTNFVTLKKEIDYEYSLLEEFYVELKEKLQQLISDFPIDETTSFFLVKMFRLDAVESNHFDLITFIERIKDFIDVSTIYNY